MMRPVPPVLSRPALLPRLSAEQAPRVEQFISLSGRVGGLLALFVLAEVGLMRLTRLPADSYEAPILSVELVRKLFSIEPVPILALVTLGLGILFGIRNRSLGPRWQVFARGLQFRALVMILATVLSWTYSTYDYNYYVEQAHALDRALLVLLLPLLVWRPVFLAPYLLVLLTVVWQFNEPIGGFSWSEPILLIRALILTGAAYVLRVLGIRLPSSDVLFVLCCLVASHYWVSGFGKLELGWIARDRVYHLLPATYANGWWGFVDPGTISAWTRGLAPMNGLMVAGTIILEGGALLSLWRPSVFRIFLVGWIGLHAGIFLMSGICFWKWIILDMALMLVFFSRGRSARLEMFTRPYFLLSVLLVGGGALWFRPVKLAWLDVPVTYTYRLIAQSDSGASYRLPPHFFAPFDYQFTLGHFHYLVTEPRLDVVWGATRNVGLASALQQIDEAEEVWLLESEMGRFQYDPRRRAAFEKFLCGFVSSKLRSGSTFWWHRIQPPSQLWTFPRHLSIPSSEQIKLALYQVTSFYDGSEYREVRQQLIGTCAVP